MSGLGKGVTASSIGVVLKACGLRVTSIKIGSLPFLIASVLTIDCNYQFGIFIYLSVPHVCNFALVRLIVFDIGHRISESLKWFLV